MTPLIVIRPQPGCDASVAAARAFGLVAQGHPLFEVRPLEWDAPDPASFDALLIDEYTGRVLQVVRNIFW